MTTVATKPLPRRSPRNLSSALALLAAPVWLGACTLIGATHVGSDVKIDETRQLEAFHRLSLAGKTEVQVSRGPEHRVELHFDDNLLPFVRTEVRNGTLLIELDDRGGNRYRFNGALEVVVVTPELDALAIAGSSRLVATGIDCEAFELDLAGSGKVTLQGRATELDLSIAGSGKLLLAELAAERVEVDIAGSGDVTLQAREALEVSIAGSGVVRYAGSPTLSKSVLGSGKVVALD